MTERVRGSLPSPAPAALARHLQCLHFTPNIMLFWHTWQTCDSQDLVENLQWGTRKSTLRGRGSRAWVDKGPQTAQGDQETWFPPRAPGTPSLGVWDTQGPLPSVPTPFPHLDCPATKSSLSKSHAGVVTGATS